MTNTLLRKAKTARSFLKEYSSKDNRKVVLVLEDAPSWMIDLCRDAHGDMMPDDHKYRFIKESLDAIIESITGGDEGELFTQVEPDIYAHDLLTWVSSNIMRVTYVDNAVENYGHGESVIDDIGMGQLVEKNEVLDLVTRTLEKLEVEG
jgi:hypothetical protein